MDGRATPFGADCHQRNREGGLGILSHTSVIPAKAGIQSHKGRRSATLDPRLRGDDE